MRILITGGNGMIGRALQIALKDHILLTPRRHELNVSNSYQVKRFAKEKLHLIIHLACETDHEYCDFNPNQCYFINTIGTAFMVSLAQDLDIPIIYQSAASIFDGKKEAPYETIDKPNPVNHYNLSKYHAEIIVRGYEKHIILRSGWLFGGGRGVDKKFVSKIIKKIEAGEREIKVCTDCIGCPTYSLDLADAYKYVIKNLIGDDWGTYNAVNDYEGNGVSRYEYGKVVASCFKDDIKIIPCKIDDLKEEFPCKRTNYEVLAKGIGMPDWKGSLRGYIFANYRH